MCIYIHIIAIYMYIYIIYIMHIFVSKKLARCSKSVHHHPSHTQG